MLHSFRLILEKKEVKKMSPQDRVKDKKSAVGI